LTLSYPVEAEFVEVSELKRDARSAASSAFADDDVE
jgi:hypothetical protein